MKITAIELSEIEINAIVNHLTNKFNTEDSKQTIEFQLNEVVEFVGVNYFYHCPDEYMIESVLELYTEYPEADENNQTEISSRSVMKYSTTFFYDGEEIKVNLDNLDKIHELIHKYYEI